MNKKLYKEIDSFKAYIVDGVQVRKTNKSFTDFAQHYDFPEMIPVEELWMDKGHGHQEYKYYIANMMAQDNLMQQGATYEEADRRGDKRERELRGKEVGIGINKRLLTDVDGVGVWLVDTKAVHASFDVDFPHGGHDLRYSWIPSREIWIDDGISVDERDKVIEHELSDRGKMSSGMKYIPTYRESPIEGNGRKKRGLRRFHLPRPKKPGLRRMKERRKRQSG